MRQIPRDCGRAISVSVMSVCVSSDSTKAVFFLVMMMPYGTGEVNQTKVSAFNRLTRQLGCGADSTSE